MNTLGLGRPVYSFGLGVPYAYTPPPPPVGGGGRPWKPFKGYDYELPDWLDEKDLRERILQDDHEVLELIVTMLTKGML